MIIILYNLNKLDEENVTFSKENKNKNKIKKKKKKPKPNPLDRDFV